MRIQFRWKAAIADTMIPPGEYEVVLSRDTSMIHLIGTGTEYKIPATKRPARVQIKHVRIQFHASLGDPIWILIVSTPPKTEWVAFIKFVKQEEVSDKKGKITGEIK